jgi:hypothetical protein
MIINLDQLYRVVFGFRGFPFPGKPEPDNINQVNLPQASVFSSSNELEIDEDLIMTTPTGVPLFMPMSINGYQLPNEPILTIKLQKKIVKTQLYGNTRKGTVKETVSTDDYSIDVRGIAINYYDKYNYPAEIVSKLNELVKLNESLLVKSPLTRLMGIDRVVIENFELIPTPGVQHVQAYRMSMSSDEDFVLEEVD